MKPIRQVKVNGKRRYHRLYQTWKNMRARCEKSYNNSYHNYGARGISVCDEWQDFDYFWAWAWRSGYTKAMTIDRIDSDGNYTPENCRWIPKGLQSRNSRKAKITEQQAEEIRKRYAVGNVTTYQLAEDYPITASSIQRIVRGETWKALADLEEE